MRSRVALRPAGQDSFAGQGRATRRASLTRILQVSERKCSRFQTKIARSFSLSGRCRAPRSAAFSFRRRRLFLFVSRLLFLKLLNRFANSSTQISENILNLTQRGAEVFGDFSGENMR